MGNTSGNLFSNIPRELPAEWFESLVNTRGITIERIISRGHASAVDDWYDQDRDEWVMLISGSAVLEYSDKTCLELQPGDWVTIPAHCRHRVAATDANRDTVWLAVHY